MKKLLVFALLATGLLWLNGCRSAVTLQGVAIDVPQIERAADGVVTATIRYGNANVVPYNIEEATHKIYLDGQLLGTAEQKKPLGLAPQSSAVVPLTVKVDGPAALSTGQHSFRIETSVRLRIYGDTWDKDKRTNSGTTSVTLR